MRYSLLFALLFAATSSLQAQEKSAPKTFKVYKSDTEWKKQLNGMQYYVLRRGGTEYAFTSELLDEKRKGTYVCAACENPVFRSEYKYNSKSGWPSFDRPIEGSLVYDIDYEIGYERTEENVVNADHTLVMFLTMAPEQLQASVIASMESLLNS